MGAFQPSGRAVRHLAIGADAVAQIIGDEGNLTFQAQCSHHGRTRAVKAGGNQRQTSYAQVVRLRRSRLLLQRRFEVAICRSRGCAESRHNAAMSKAILGPTFGLTSSKDLYQKLLWEAEKLEAENWSPFAAFNFIVTAWHLHDDWVRKDSGLRLPRTKVAKVEVNYSDLRLVLQIVQDLANGSKHVVLNASSNAQRVVEDTHLGDIGDHYEYLFHESIPGVTVGDSYFSIRVLRNILCAYFAWVFDDEVALDELPRAILDSIAYCNIATRQIGEPPELWSRGGFQT